MPVGLPGYALFQAVISLLPSQADLVLRDFLAADPATFMRNLEQRRPEPITQQDKRRLIDALPMEGRVSSFGRSVRAKLDSLRVVLRYYRRDSVYEVMVIRIPEAYTGIYARSVILISERSLVLLETTELQAVVAHEAAHEYFWTEFHEARNSMNQRRLQDLELYCDGVAIIAMLQLGLDASRLMTGIERITDTNKRRLGEAANENSYPPLGERKRFAKALIESAARVHMLR